MNNTPFTTVAILAAALLIGAIAITPSVFASSDGNTITKEKNKGKTIASGFGTIAVNIQPNAVCAEVEACIGGITDGAVGTENTENTGIPGA
jgi:hypothetical protein